MDVLIGIATVGSVGVIVGLTMLLWLRQRPGHRRWVPFALVVTAGSIAILFFGLVPPVALWLMLGAP